MVDSATVLSRGERRSKRQGVGRAVKIPMEIYLAGISDQDRRQAAALLAKPPSRVPDAEAPGERPARPIVDVSYPETDPDLAQLLKAKNLTDAEVEEVLELTVGPGGVEPPTSRLSGVRSNHLSYRPYVLHLPFLPTT